MPRTASALPPFLALAAATALAAPSALAGPAPQLTRWAAPVSGAFYDAARWENGVAPSEAIGAIIDAAGSPYTVIGAEILPGVRSILIDSADATLGTLTQNLSLQIIESLEVRRGRFALQGRVVGGEIRVRPGALFDILNEPLINGIRGAQLRSNVINEGEMTIAGEAIIAQQPRFTDPIPTDRSITNAATGVMCFRGGNFVNTATLNNYGLIDVENAPEFQGPGVFTFDGTAFGYIRSFGSGDAPAVVNNYGVIRLHQRDLHIEGSGEHSGRFEILSANSTLQFRGDHTFLPGMEVTGPGLTRLHNHATMAGEIRTEGDLELRQDYPGVTIVDLALDVGGELRFDVGGSGVTFTRDLRAGLINTTGYARVTFEGVVDAGFSPLVQEMRFLNDATIRGDLIANGAQASFVGDAVITGDASNIAVARGAEIRGDLFGGARGEGRIAVAGDLIATQGAWTFNTPLNAPERTRIEVGGDATVAAPFNLAGDLAVGGAFAAQSGRFENITADTVRFAAMNSGASVVVLENGSTIESRNGPVVIEGLTLRADPTGGAYGREQIVFDGGLEMRAGAGLGVFVNPMLNNATTYAVLGDAVLNGALHIAVFGETTDFTAGDSFTILEARASDRLATPPSVSGELELIYNGSLPDGLFFDLVYEPSAVRLVVLPAPGASVVLGLAGLVAFRRRPRR